MNNLVLHKQFTTPKNDVTISTSDGRSIQELIDYLQIPESSYCGLKVYISGTLVDQGMYRFVRPKDNAMIKLILLPEGDNSQTFFMIAMIAIAVAAPYAAPAMGVTNAWGAAAITAGITIGGSLALNAMFPPPLAPEISSSSIEGSKALTIAGSRNSFSYDKPIPRVYGTVKFYPPHAAQPYTISEGGVQYLYMIFDLGYGPLSLTDLKIGETSIDDYIEVDYYVRESVSSVNDLEYFTGDIDNEVVNATLSDGDPATTRTTSTELKYAQFDLLFSGGLYGINSSVHGSIIVLEEINFGLVVRDENNLVIPNASISLTKYSISSANFLPTATGFTIESESEDGFSITIEIRTLLATIPDYITVELSRVSTTTNGEQTIDSCVYTTLRTFRLGLAIKPFRIIDDAIPTRVTHTMVEMKIRATDQLNGVVDNFNCIASSLLRKWNGTTFDAPAITDNPAWIYADVLTGTLNQRPKSDDRINWNELKRWADFCDILAEGENSVSTKAHTCNFVLDYSTTIFKLLIDIASVGRASPDIYDDMYSVIFDEPKSAKVQIFTNMNTMDFSSSRLYTEIPDAVRVNFRDPESDWQMRELIVYNDGFDIDTAKVFEDIAAPMLTSSNEAYRNGRYWIKQAALRKETITFKTDLEWLDCKRGSYVSLQMDIIKAGGSTARIKSVSGEKVIVDSDPALNGNLVEYFELRKIDGTIVSGPVAFYSIDNKFEVDLGIVGASIGDMIVINTFGLGSYDLLIKQIDVNSDQSAIVTCLEYVPELYDLASDPVPTYDPSITNIIDLKSAPGKLLYVNINETLALIDKIPYITLTLDYQPNNGIIPSYYKIFKQDFDTAEWIIQGNTEELSFVWGDSILAIDNQIIGSQHCFSVVGVSDNNDFINPALGTQVCIVPQGDLTIPTVPDYFVVEDTAENFRRFWWEYRVTVPHDDLEGYIIRYTKSLLADWSAATPLHEGILSSPPFEIRALPPGAQIVMLRSIDTSGHYSDESVNISFNMGDRPVENVLYENFFNPFWPGQLVSGSALIISSVLTVDTNTSGFMWNADSSVFMWVDDPAIMWTSPNDSFKWIEDITVTQSGITSINWVGTGEVKLFYSLGIFQQSFKQVENLLLSPENQDDIEWTGPATAANTATRGPDESLRVYSIIDFSTTVMEFVSASYTLLNPLLPVWASCYIIKDTRGRLERFPMMRVGITGNTTPYADIRLDTATGEISVIAGNGGVVFDSGVIDSGDFWFVYLSIISTDASNTDCYLELYPSAGAALDWTYNVLIESDTETFGYSLYNQTAFLPYIPLSDLIYSGDGQGLIQYTSPINLDAGDYMLMVDSPISVDINTLSELSWTIDVPDINEYFEDHIVTTSTAGANGGYEIALTKTFTKVTNVSIVLQADATNPPATTVVVVFKSSTVIELKAYSDLALQVRAQALVDIRIQGY